MNVGFLLNRFMWLFITRGMVKVGSRKTLHGFRSMFIQCFYDPTYNLFQNTVFPKLSHGNSNFSKIGADMGGTSSLVLSCEKNSWYRE